MLANINDRVSGLPNWMVNHRYSRIENMLCSIWSVASSTCVMHKLSSKLGRAVKLISHTGAGRAPASEYVSGYADVSVSASVASAWGHAAQGSHHRAQALVLRWLEDFLPPSKLVSSVLSFSVSTCLRYIPALSRET